jgi:phage portal protein BeeE
MWRSLDVASATTAPVRGETKQTVDIRETTSPESEFERKMILLSGYYQAMGPWGITGVPGRSWDVLRAVREGYARVVWVYKSVEVLSNNQSRLPVIAQEGKQIIPDHPTAMLLNGTKCSQLGESGKVYRKRLSQQTLLSPRGAFTETVLSRARTPLSYTLLPPNRTRAVPASDGSIDHFEVDPLRIGDKPRRIEPDLVRWTREPHPLDPYAGMTPLEAAGLSIEMDHFARLFNRSFMANDGRPGMIVGIQASEDDSGDLDPLEAERIERKFGRGPLEAGRTVVVDGKVTAVDMGGAPRDGSWLSIREAGKDEILVAFGVPESQIGNASGSTFANAAEEKEAFWLITQEPHNDTIDDTWAVDALDAAVEVTFDYKGTPVRERLEKEHRQEMREEVGAGVRTGVSYQREAGFAEEDIIDAPGNRVLWVTGGVPIGDKDDQDAAAKLTPVGAKGTPNPTPNPQAGAPGGPGALPGQPGGMRAIMPGRAPAAFKGRHVGERKVRTAAAVRVITDDDE